MTASVKFDSTEVIGIECSAPRWDINENDSYQYPLSVSGNTDKSLRHIAIRVARCTTVVVLFSRSNTI